jgi:hypothetical protein
MLLDDIATMLDDVAVMTKVAAKKTAGVLGDDLALNAQQVTGFTADRELPVVWAVAKGSAVNKLILVPAAMLISIFLPWAVTPLLMLGGAFLCFEGVEKLVHKWLHPEDKHKEALSEAFQNPEVDLVEFERTRIKGAIRTDFILSAEIVTISLGAAQDSTLAVKFGVLVAISAVMTVGVYGLVAGIVKLDDLGFYLTREAETSASRRAMGRAILLAAPRLMKILSVVGTAAMFLVGGGIVVHGIGPVHHWVEHVAHMAGPLEGLVASILNGGIGIAVGAVIVAVVMGISRVLGRSAH